MISFGTSWTERMSLETEFTRFESIVLLYVFVKLYFRLGHRGPRTNIVTSDQRELAKRNNHVISTPFKMMYIMADLSLEDR